ncbi:MAG: extracellular solute-binding protein [Treponema sp.]|nr:extracellular solute-binding protein [Treponema sp.]
MPLTAGGRNQAARVDLDAPVHLTLWTWEDPNRTVFEKEFIEEFNKTNPNVTVEYSTGPSNSHVERITIAFAANQGPDLFNNWGVNMRPLILNGRVAPLDPALVGASSSREVIERFMPSALDWTILNGNLYGLPFEYGISLNYLNKNIFRSAGLDPERDYPKTWEEMMSVSEKIVRREGDIITRRGFDFRWPISLSSILVMVEQLGGGFASADGRNAIIGDDAWIKVFEYFRQWGPSGRNLGGPTYATPRTLFNLDNDEVAMTPSGLYQTSRIKAANPSFYESGNWMVFPNPVFENAVNRDVGEYVTGSNCYAVNSQISQAKQTWSWRLINFFISHPDEYLSRAALLIPSYEALNSASFKAIPYSGAFSEAMQKAKSMPFIYVPEMDERVQTAVNAAVNGEDPRVILTRFRREMQDIIDQNR